MSLLKDPKGEKFLTTKAFSHIVPDTERSKKRPTIGEVSGGDRLEALSLQRLSRFVNADLGPAAMSGICEGILHVLSCV